MYFDATRNPGFCGLTTHWLLNQFLTLTTDLVRNKFLALTTDLVRNKFLALTIDLESITISSPCPLNLKINKFLALTADLKINKFIALTTDFEKKIMLSRDHWPSVSRWRARDWTLSHTPAARSWWARRPTRSRRRRGRRRSDAGRGRDAASRRRPTVATGGRCRRPLSNWRHLPYIQVHVCRARVYYWPNVHEKISRKKTCNFRL